MKISNLLLSLLACLVSIGAFAQKNEIKIMYSPLSLQRVDNWGRDLDGLSGKYTGAFMLDYNRYMTSRIKLGVNIGYDNKKISGKSFGVIRNPHFPFDFIETFYDQSNKEGWLFFGPQLGYDYIQKDNFRLGSLVGISMVLINREDIITSETDIVNTIRTTETDTNFFFHVELLNFTWGRTNGLTGQLGYGHKGLVSLGYFFRW